MADITAATPYSPQGTLVLPRVHIPTWFGSFEPSSYNDCRLNLSIISQIDTPDIAITDTENYVSAADYLINFSDATNISNTTTRTHDRITIGTQVASLGTIEFYSDEEETLLSGTPSAHVMAFQHASLKSFNFKISHNHVIDRIEKLYRAIIGTTNQNLSTITTATDSSGTNKLVINSTNESDATISGEKLTLIEGGH